MIKLENVTKIYKGKSEGSSVIALDSVSLTIPDGAFVSITGRSGSGKSTLLHMLGGVDRPTSGAVFIDGQDISNISDRDLSLIRNRKIGFVFQAFLLEPSLSAIENVELPLLIRGISGKKAMQMARDMLEKVGLEHRVFHRPSEMSGGEKQRVSIARALVTEPQILLADEPTGNLDEKTGKEILNLMRRLSENRTFVLVTHEIAEAESAPVQVVMKDGKILTCSSGLESLQ